MPAISLKTTKNADCVLGTAVLAVPVRDTAQQLAGAREDKSKAGREGGESSGLSRTAAARRRHGHGDDALISPTSSIPGHAPIRDRIDRAKGMAVGQAIQLTIYTNAIAQA